MRPSDATWQEGRSSRPGVRNREERHVSAATKNNVSVVGIGLSVGVGVVVAAPMTVWARRLPLSLTVASLYWNRLWAGLGPQTKAVKGPGDWDSPTYSLRDLALAALWGAKPPSRQGWTLAVVAARWRRQQNTEAASQPNADTVVMLGGKSRQNDTEVNAGTDTQCSHSRGDARPVDLSSHPSGECAPELRDQDLSLREQ